MMNGVNHGWGMGFSWIAGLFVLVVILWFVVKAINQNYNSNRSGKKSPQDILNERYARGEIEKSEYEEKKKDLL
ncbi:MAG: SHOCT domain-containing protein [Bacteroidales bacterium]|nr:SHOCT domain-containing protein [Bacteroidales bacterium]